MALVPAGADERWVDHKRGGVGVTESTEHYHSPRYPFWLSDDCVGESGSLHEFSRYVFSYRYIGGDGTSTGCASVNESAVAPTVTFPCIPAGSYELRLYINSGSPPVWRRPLTIRSRRSVTRIGEPGDTNCSAICAAPSMAMTTSPVWAANVINPPESSRRYSAGREVYSNSGSEVVTDATMRAVCAALPPNTTMVEVVMGEVHDFFRPVPGHTVCEMLQSNRLHEYYDGDNGWVAPSYDAHPNFGGSLDGWPRRENATGGDNRRFLSFWYYRRKGAHAVESLMCGDSSDDDGDDDSGSAATPELPQCAVYGRPDLPRCPPFSSPNPTRWRTSSGVLIGTVDVQAQPGMLHEHARDPGNVSCADVNGAWPLNESECWEAARSNNLSVSRTSRGYSWVDRPAGCWMHQTHVVNAVTGERRDRVFYNTNSNRSSICRADHDQRPEIPGVDVDECRRFPLVCGVRDSTATVTYVNEAGTGPGVFAHLYSYANRSAAAAACVRSGADGLCSKVDIEGYSHCALGWMADFIGYWMQGPLPPNTGCGGTYTGYRNGGGGERLAGAYCCLSTTPAPSSPAAANCVSGAELDTWYGTATPGVATRSLCCPAGHFRVGASGICRYDEHSEHAACALYGNYGTMRCPELCPAGLRPTWTPDVRPGGCCSSNYSVSYQNWSQPFSINAIAANSPSRSDGPLLCDTCPTGNCYLRSATDSACNVVVDRINRGADGTNFSCDDWHRLRSDDCERDAQLLGVAIGDVDMSCEGTDGVPIIRLANCTANLARLNAFLPIDIEPNTLVAPGGSQLDAQPNTVVPVVSCTTFVWFSRTGVWHHILTLSYGGVELWTSAEQRTASSIHLGIEVPCVELDPGRLGGGQCRSGPVGAARPWINHVGGRSCGSRRWGRPVQLGHMVQRVDRTGWCGVSPSRRPVRGQHGRRHQNIGAFCRAQSSAIRAVHCGRLGWTVGRCRAVDASWGDSVSFRDSGQCGHRMRPGGDATHGHGQGHRRPRRPRLWRYARHHG